jgi:hypothetical protein
MLTKIKPFLSGVCNLLRNSHSQFWLSFQYLLFGFLIFYLTFFFFLMEVILAENYHNPTGHQGMLQYTSKEVRNFYLFILFLAVKNYFSYIDILFYFKSRLVNCCSQWVLRL